MRLFKARYLIFPIFSPIFLIASSLKPHAQTTSDAALLPQRDGSHDCVVVPRLTLDRGAAGDPSLRLKSGSAQDDAGDGSDQPLQNPTSRA